MVEFFPGWHRIAKGCVNDSGDRFWLVCGAGNDGLRRIDSLGSDLNRLVHPNVAMRFQIRSRTGVGGLDRLAYVFSFASHALRGEQPSRADARSTHPACVDLCFATHLPVGDPEGLGFSCGLSPVARRGVGSRGESLCQKKNQSKSMGG